MTFIPSGLRVPGLSQLDAWATDAGFAAGWMLVRAMPEFVARNAFGFRNADNQRLRTRCVTTRRARGHLRTAQL